MKLQRRRKVSRTTLLPCVSMLCRVFLVAAAALTWVAVPGCQSQDAYHGETMGAMAPEGMSQPYTGQLGAPAIPEGQPNYVR